MSNKRHVRVIHVVTGLKVAAAKSNYTVALLKWMRKAGCPAFRRDGTIDLRELDPWYEVNKPVVDPDSLPSKEQLQILCLQEDFKSEAAQERDRGR